jgi:hypothetical protein
MLIKRKVVALVTTFLFLLIFILIINLTIMCNKLILQVDALIVHNGAISKEICTIFAL